VDDWNQPGTGTRIAAVAEMHERPVTGSSIAKLYLPCIRLLLNRFPTSPTKLFAFYKAA
jgi:hypothetical protein